MRSSGGTSSATPPGTRPRTCSGTTTRDGFCNYRAAGDSDVPVDVAPGGAAAVVCAACGQGDAAASGHGDGWRVGLGRDRRRWWRDRAAPRGASGGRWAAPRARAAARQQRRDGRRERRRRGRAGRRRRRGAGAGPRRDAGGGRGGAAAGGAVGTGGAWSRRPGGGGPAARRAQSGQSGSAGQTAPVDQTTPGPRRRRRCSTTSTASRWATRPTSASRSARITSCRWSTGRWPSTARRARCTRRPGCRCAVRSRRTRRSRAPAAAARRGAATPPPTAGRRRPLRSAGPALGVPAAGLPLAVRDVLRGQRRGGSAGDVSPLRVRAPAVPRLPAARDLAGRLLRRQQHGRRRRAEDRSASPTACG